MLHLHNLKYRNKKSGQIIEIASALISDNWEALEQEPPIVANEGNISDKKPSRRKKKEE